MIDYALFSSEQIRQCEKLALSHLHLPAEELMKLAGAAAFTLLQSLYPHVHKIIVYCGSGNNAGDGYELARLAHLAGYNVIINQYKLPDELPASARAAAYAALHAGVICHWMEDEPAIIEADLIVDALLGIGLHQKVREPIASAINQINDSGLPVLSLDIPSGLEADTGNCLGVCVKATVTLTFIGKKKGMYTLQGIEHCGTIYCDNLGLSLCLNKLTPSISLLVKDITLPKLAPRPLNCNKSNFGHVLVVGGDSGMPGAVRLGAMAALRVGAGMVTIATRPEYAFQGASDLFEVMIKGITTDTELLPLIKKATVCVVGPGLGLDEWGKQLFKQVLASQLPMVIDASALRLLAMEPQHDDNWILTPHPGEAAALLDCSIGKVQSNRFKAISQLQKKYGGNIILKGAGTLIRTDEQENFICNAGNPGMASAGMGDILSGVIAGLIAQKLSLADAAKLGVWLHATAGDEAALKEGMRGLIATDLLPHLRTLVNN